MVSTRVDRVDTSRHARRLAVGNVAQYPFARFPNHFTMSREAKGVPRNRRAQEAKERQKRLRGNKRFRSLTKHIDADDVYNAGSETLTLFFRGWKTFADSWEDAYQWFRDRAHRIANPTGRQFPTEDEMKVFSATVLEMEENFKAAEPLPTEDYPLLWETARELVRKVDVVMDPQLTDVMNHRLWETWVPAEIRSQFEFRNSSGDGWVFKEETGLWRAVDFKQMQQHIFSVAHAHFSTAKVVFTSEKQEVYWRQKICDQSTYNGMINHIKGMRMYPNPIETSMDRSPWLIPLQDNRVFDAKTVTVRKRTRDDLFTQETGFSYLDREEVNEDELWNDEKIRNSLFDDFSNKSEEAIVDHLTRLCPMAMAWIKNTFTDPGRLWFILLRLGTILSGFCTREVLFVYGKGKGGKSTLFQTITEICGDLGIVLLKSSFIKNKMETGSSHRTDLKRAVGRRVAIVDELESSDHINETILKNWASHQKIPMREIYGKQSEDTLRSFLIFLTNEPPRFSQEDTTIRERVRAVRVTTKYFDKDCPPNEKPAAFVDQQTWQDGYSESEDTYWIYRTGKKEQGWRQYKEKNLYKNELGTLLCLLTAIVYRITKNGTLTQLPIPEKVLHDSKAFFEESDVVETFLNEYYIDEKVYRNAVTLKDVYDKFKLTFNDLGIKSFTFQTFKRALNGKNLLFPANKHRAVKVKKALKSSSSDVWVPS